MTINYKFNCIWDIEKQERISNLLSERVSLLLGNYLHNKVDAISFINDCEVKDEILCKIKKSTNSELLVNEFVSQTSSYEFMISKDILLDMLEPGSGQSNFDSIILKLRNISTK